MCTDAPNVKFSYQQKIAMMRVLSDIINADGIVDSRETFYFNQLMHEFNMHQDDRTIVDEKNSLLALAQLDDMDKAQKEYFSKLMTKMVIVDGDVNVNEVTLYDVVAKFCGFDTRFQEQQLPEGLTRS